MTIDIILGFQFIKQKRRFDENFNFPSKKSAILREMAAILREGVDHTVWKFHNFYVTQILREINFGECRGSKTADFAIFGGFEFC